MQQSKLTAEERVQVSEQMRLLRAYSLYHRSIGDVKLSETIKKQGFKGRCPSKFKGMTSNEYADGLEMEIYLLQEKLEM